MNPRNPARNPRNPARRQPAPRQSSRPVPVERGRAAGVVIGLLLFTAGFAVAGCLVIGGLGGTPGYQVAITVGLVGIGMGGFFLHRGTVELPEGKIWSPAVLRALVEPLALPAVPVIGALYVLFAVGLVGNLVLPLANRG